MAIYLALKPWILAVLVIGALYLFFKQINTLMMLLKSVKGKTVAPLDAIKERIGVLITDVLGQRNVRRKFPAGLAHMGIFLGFIALGPHSLEMFIEGFARHFSWGLLSHDLYAGYLFLTDFFAFGVILGVSYGLVRRTLIRPRYLTNGPSAIFILCLIFLIVTSFFGANALRIAINTKENYAAYEPISKLLVSFFGLTQVGQDKLLVIYEFIYWCHVLPILYFLIYIPSSKHLHILAAAPNVFLKPLKKEKAIFKTNLEDENATNYGLGKSSDLNWKNVLDLYACTECGRCEEQCPASYTGKKLSPKWLIHDLKVNLLQEGLNIKQKGEAAEPFVSEKTNIPDEVIWQCTSCRACENICPVNIQHLDIILEARKNLVLMEARFPPELQSTMQNEENQSNPWGLGQDSRGNWLKGLEVPLAAEKEDAEYLYYAGCFGCYNEQGIKIAQSIVNLFKHAKVDFMVLGAEETCCGDPVRRGGNEYLAQMQINQLAETFGKYKFKKIVTGCPHCYNTFKNEYPQFSAQYDVVHHSEVLSDLVASHAIVPKNAGVVQNVTFHDSCYLTRWNSVTKPPRRILESIPGCEITPMQRTEEKTFCCGAGGAQMFMEEKVGKRINHERVEEAINTGAATLATACPYCNTMLADGVKAKNSKMAVTDVAEILWNSVK